VCVCMYVYGRKITKDENSTQKYLIYVYKNNIFIN
jgi:hypothetical protein